MHATRHRLQISLATGLLALGAVCAPAENVRYADLKAEVARLTRQKEALTKSLVEANKREAEAARALAEVRLRMEALGKNLFDGGDDRLVKAASDLEVLNRRVSKLEEAGHDLVHEVRNYVVSAIAADPELRKNVEAATRRMEALIGIRNAPVNQAFGGSREGSRVISIDQESGAIILNAGRKSDMQIGLPLELKRNGSVVAQAVVALIRPDVSAALVQSFTDKHDEVQIGDLAVFKKN